MRNPRTPSGASRLRAASTLCPLAVRALLGGLAVLAAGCVTETVGKALPDRPVLFDLPTGVLAAGAYHGVTFFFEVDLRSEPGADGQLISEDLPNVANWNELERDADGDYYRQLPPIIPEITDDGREVYRLGSLHRVDYHLSMFQVGQYRYARQPKARLYVFKRWERGGAFEFLFRGQKIVVPSQNPWVPSIFYYPQEVWDGDSWETVGEVVQVGLATIQTLPEEGCWLVNGKRYYPDPSRGLQLRDALHAVGTR